MVLVSTQALISHNIGSIRAPTITRNPTLDLKMQTRKPINLKSLNRLAANLPCEILLNILVQPMVSIIAPFIGLVGLIHSVVRV